MYNWKKSLKQHKKLDSQLVQKQTRILKKHLKRIDSSRNSMKVVFLHKNGRNIANLAKKFKKISHKKIRKLKKLKNLRNLIHGKMKQ